MFHFVGFLWDMQATGYWLTLLVGMVVVIGCDLMLYTAKPVVWLLGVMLRCLWVIVLALNLLITGLGGFFYDPMIAAAIAAELLVMLGPFILLFRGFRHVNAIALGRLRAGLPGSAPTAKDDIAVQPGWDEGEKKS